MIIVACSSLMSILIVFICPFSYFKILKNVVPASNVSLICMMKISPVVFYDCILVSEHVWILILPCDFVMWLVSHDTMIAFYHVCFLFEFIMPWWRLVWMKCVVINKGFFINIRVPQIFSEDCLNLPRFLNNLDFHFFSFLLFFRISVWFVHSRLL